MNIHEHQAKELLNLNKVNVARGIPAFSVNEALTAAKKLGGPIWVVKAQIHAGGRIPARRMHDCDGQDSRREPGRVCATASRPGRDLDL